MGAPGGVIPPLGDEVHVPKSPPWVTALPVPAAPPARAAGFAWPGMGRGHSASPGRTGDKIWGCPHPPGWGNTKGGGAAAPRSDGKAKTPTPANRPPQTPPGRGSPTLGHLPPLSPPRPAATHLMPGTPHTSSCGELFGGDPSVLLLSPGHQTTPRATRPCAVATAEPPRRSAHPRACDDGASERATVRAAVRALSPNPSTALCRLQHR